MAVLAKSAWAMLGQAHPHQNAPDKHGRRLATAAEEFPQDEARPGLGPTAMPWAPHAASSKPAGAVRSKGTSLVASCPFATWRDTHVRRPAAPDPS